MPRPSVGELIRFITYSGRITWEDGRVSPKWCTESDRYFEVLEVADKGNVWRVVIGNHRKGLNGSITHGVTGAILVSK